MIKINNLTKIYTTEEVETTALNSISLEIKDGEFVAIMGPSGCGKSTLVNLLPRFYDLTKGRILIDGVNIRDDLRGNRIVQDLFDASSNRTNRKISEQKLGNEQTRAQIAVNRIAVVPHSPRRARSSA